jgi:hypothetical protein
MATNSETKSTPTNFLDLPREIRQSVFLISLNDSELHKLNDWKICAANQHDRVIRILDCHTEFRKQAAALRKADLALVDDVDFAKERWVDTYEKLITKWKKVENWWTY